MIIIGLYDPVLDDYEPIYESIDTLDFDQPSRPSEVQFEIQKFIELPNGTQLNDQLTPISDFTLGQHGSRSLTASPFLVPTKPYRPFSTDPIDVPPLEDPIILNPNYKDDFGRYGSQEILPETSFKLPISEQYDPDGTKRKRVTTKTEIVTKEMRKEEREKIIKEEIRYMEQMRKDIDLDKIESTATSIVDESITKALTVAEEIKNEIDIDLRESMTRELESKTEMSVKETKGSNIKKEFVSEELMNDSKEFVDLIDNTTDNILNKGGGESEVNVTKDMQKLGSINKEGTNIETKSSSKQEIEEIIEVGSVRRKSTVFDKKAEAKITIDKKEATKSTDKTKKDVSDIKIVDVSKTKEVKKNQEKAKMQSSQTSEKSTARLLAEQRAYTIGLQTIPHIKGSIHSSYHYNLLLKTFFIHLTDVMVALSRFILSEPVLSEEIVQKDTVTEKKITQEVVTVNQANRSEHERAEKQIDKQVIQEHITHDEDKKAEQYVERKDIVDITETEDKREIQEHFAVEGERRVRKLSGAKMAQMAEKKSEELIQKMGAVVSEFQTKAGIEDGEVKAELNILRDSRSRSRSIVKDNILDAKETLEFVSQMENKKASQEIIETTSKTVTSNTESFKKKAVQGQHGAREFKSGSEEGTNTYVAIVEAHVYTNKDAIFEEHLAEVSETASILSAEETNIAHEAKETVSTKKVAIENSEVENVATASVESQKLITLVKNDVEVLEETSIGLEESKEVQQREFEKTVEDIKEVRVNETIEVIEPAIEIEQVQTVETCKELSTEVEEEKVELEVEESIKVFVPKEVVKPVQDEYAELKIVKEEVIEVEPAVEVIEEEINVHRKIDQSLIIDAETQETTIEKSQELQTIEGSFGSHLEESVTQSHVYQENKIERNYESQEMIQESTFIARSIETSEIEAKKLTVQTDIQAISDENNNIDTPTPSTVPPTPLTDEYVFKLKIPLPKSRSTTPAPKQPSPEKITDEDPHIVKKKLIPVIDSPVIESVIYDPPLPTPEEEKVQPKYTKPGLRGGADREEFGKDEIMEIERKSSLLASAIDETIKSIEEYKEEFGIETNKKVEIQEVNSISTKVEKSLTKKEIITENGSVVNGQLVNATDDKTCDVKAEVKNKYEEEWNVLKKQVETNNENINKVLEKLDETNVQLVVTEQLNNENNVDVQNSINETEIVIVNADTSTSNAETEMKQLEISSATNVEENPLKSEEIPETEIEPDIFENNVKADDVKIEIQTTEFTKELEKKKEEYSFKPVEFNPENLPPSRPRSSELYTPVEMMRESSQEPKIYVTETGEVLGTTHGIVDGLEKPVVDEEDEKELGKPGMSEEKIAELISGEAEMLREAHVMGLSRVLSSHMHRDPDDDSSVDFQKIKPLVESLKDSEVLKALNEDLERKKKEEKKKEEKRWTTFLMKPNRPVPRAKFGYHGYIVQHEEFENPYKVKIVKQPKPKIAPDFKPENFDTGPLPWEERALNEPPLPPLEPEEPILIPEDVPEFLEAVDPLPESEIPDLEETGIPLPPEKEPEELLESVEIAEEEDHKESEEFDLEAVVEETENILEENLIEEKLGEEMEQNKLAEQLIKNVESMVDPNAPLEQQLAQMRAQLAALARLPGVIQHTLELVTSHLEQLGKMETLTQSAPSAYQVSYEENCERNEVTQNHIETIQEETSQQIREVDEYEKQMEEINQENREESNIQEVSQSLARQELQKVGQEEQEILDEQRRIEKQKKDLIDQLQQEQESRQIKQRPTPRAGKPKPVFGPLTPQERPLVLPGGRRWRKPQDAYNEQLIAETLSAQAEIIQGKAKGINFKKYEKPPVSLEHLKHSDVYKLIHDLEQSPMKRVEMLTPVIAEADYREKCRSMTPNADRVANKEQLQP